ncbi:MAG: hypothetical protein KDE47_25655 [Caldilineaceae bacterium]|nr:hypothetical protein [Caldilineaceae bacterium]
MKEHKKLSELSWGLISGTALGIGASLGWAWRSWELFFVVSIILTLLMVWWMRR